MFVRRPTRKEEEAAETGSKKRGFGQAKHAKHAEPAGSKENEVRQALGVQAILWLDHDRGRRVWYGESGGSVAGQRHKARGRCAKSAHTAHSGGARRSREQGREADLKGRDEGGASLRREAQGTRDRLCNDRTRGRSSRERAENEVRKRRGTGRGAETKEWADIAVAVLAAAGNRTGRRGKWKTTRRWAEEQGGQSARGEDRDSEEGGAGKRWRHWDDAQIFGGEGA
ncbi:hypothetical protein ERJ75_000583100 [Trypanosoma vivax]|nr:hypothetical protein ERJ75_000583100 [Trypanosoma vivax]